MSLSPTTGDFITLEEAQSYVLEFRKEFPTAIKGYFAGGENLQRILAQPDCIGLRIYNGLNVQDMSTNLVIVGVDSNELDMTSGLILEKTDSCPGTCDTTSALYS